MRRAAGSRAPPARPPARLHAARPALTLLLPCVPPPARRRNELRVYLRDRPLEVRLPVDDDERDYD